LWNCAQNFFFKTCRQRTSKLRLNFTANSFVFGRTNLENAPTTFFMKLEKQKFQNASELQSKQLRFWTHKSWNCAHNFFCKPCRQSTSKMRLNFHNKQLRFWTHKSWNCIHNFFCKTRRQRTSRTRQNSTANHFIFGRINRENAPRTSFMKLERRKLLKCF